MNKPRDIRPATPDEQGQSQKTTRERPFLRSSGESEPVWWGEEGGRGEGVRRRRATIQFQTVGSWGSGGRRRRDKGQAGDTGGNTGGLGTNWQAVPHEGPSAGASAG